MKADADLRLTIIIKDALKSAVVALSEIKTVKGFESLKSIAPSVSKLFLRSLSLSAAKSVPDQVRCTSKRDHDAKQSLSGRKCNAIKRSALLAVQKSVSRTLTEASRKFGQRASHSHLIV